MKNQILLKYIFYFLLACCALPVYSQSKDKAKEDTSAFVFRQIPNYAFKTGEELVFRLHYGFVTAGKAIFVIDKKLHKVNDRVCYKISAVGTSESAFAWFMNVKDELHTFVDTQALAPLQYTRKVREGDYKFDDEVKFNYPTQELSAKKGVFNLNTYVQDVVSAFYYARCLNLSDALPGDIYQIPTFLDDAIYPLRLRVLGRETIETEFGKIRCLKIAPLVVVGRVFKGDEDMVIWVTDDDNYLPIRIESPIVVGSVKADLVDYKRIKNPFTSLMKD